VLRGKRRHRRHLVHPLSDAGYRTILIGEQHISVDPAVIGYDEVIHVDSNRATDIAPITAEAMGGAVEPWFMSVGFFETHRDFAAPTSVRDSLYSLPPANLPDTKATRQDIAAFKASARSLDQGIGAVLHQVHDLDLQERTLVICTTDHGLAFPGAKATLFDRGIGVMLVMRGPGGFTGGRVIDSLVSHLDIYPTLCEIAGTEKPDFLQGRSLMPLVHGEVDRVNDEIFSEVTFHAAYEPQRAIRTPRWKYIRRYLDYDRVVLANCDDSASKQLLVEAGWGNEHVDREQLYDLVLDPAEGRNLAGDPDHDQVLAELSGRLTDWMRETDDPLLQGDVEPPPGAQINLPTEISPDEPVTVVGESEPAPSS
jgi:N-sulfoglucosamine sulfohydrolase